MASTKTDTFIGGDVDAGPAKPDPILEQMKANVKEQMAARRARNAARDKQRLADLGKGPKKTKGSK